MSRAFTTLTAQLAAAQVPHHLHTHAPMQTVQEAIALGFPPEQLLKTVVFKSKAGAWYLVAMRGQDQADYKLLAAATGVKRDDLICPAPDEVHTVLGFEPGAVGPLAPQPGVTVVVDQTAARTLGTVFTGIGRRDHTLEIALPDLLAFTQALVAPATRAVD